jgi:Tol biopolymer transport system component
MNSPRLAVRHAAACLGTLAAAWSLGAAPASAASLPAGSTAILSGAPSLTDPLPAPVGSTNQLGPASVSQDGRYVAFESTSNGLVEGDDDGVRNVYVKDRTTGAVTFVSRATGADGEPSHDVCEEAAISDDGSRVAFTCDASLDPADTNTTEDVYVRDLGTSSTTLVSRAGALGAVGDARSGKPAISGTGEFVAFQSDARNLDPAKPDSGTAVYRRQIGGADATTLVSREAAALGGEARNGSTPSMSDDGSKVAFVSFEAIDPLDGNSQPDAYVRDLPGGHTLLASRGSGLGTAGNGPSRAPALAGDGSAVAFESDATNLVGTGDTDAEPDVYRRSLGGTVFDQQTHLVSVNAGGQKGSDSTSPSIDDSGEIVGFISAATELHPDDTLEGPDAYVKDLVGGGLEIASRADGDTGSVANVASDVAVSGDGKAIAVGLARGRIAPDLDPRRAAVILRDTNANPRRTASVSRPPGDAPFVNAGIGGDNVTLSADGRFAAFESSGVGLPDGVDWGVVVRDRVTGETTFASRTDGAQGAPFAGFPGQPAISADGRSVAFVAEAGAHQGVWVRDLDTGRTELASRADGPGGAPGDGTAGGPALDADGSRVAFTSAATNLGDGDMDDVLDVHVRDIQTDQTILVSRADGPDGRKGNGTSQTPSISADGSRVAFVTVARNLANGDGDAAQDVHLRDLATGATRLVSATPDGVKSDGDVSAPSIDAAGVRVAFEAPAGALTGTGSTLRQVFVRDFADGTLVLASRAPGLDGAPAEVGAFEPLISPDGRYVAFESTGGNLAAGTPGGASQVYLRDLAAGRIELVSRASGADGAPAQFGGSLGGISEGGGCVSFDSDTALLGPAGDDTQAYLRAVRADCAAADPVPGPVPVPGGEPDTVAPVLSDVRLARRKFRSRRGTTLRFRSTEAATLRVAFKRGGKRAGAITRPIAEGPGRLRLRRLGLRRLGLRRPLRAGRYRLTLVATDAAGNRSKAVRRKFRIVK